MAGEQPTQAPSGGDQNPSGVSGDQDPKQTTSGDGGVSDGGSVSWETYQKTLSQEKNLRARIKELEDKEAERERKNAEENENYKSLADQYKTELETTKSKLTEVQDTITRSRKVNALLGQLDGNVDPKFWHLIDTDKIVMDGDGNIDKMSLSKAAERFQKEYSQVIESASTVDVPPTPPKGANGSAITMDRFTELSRDKNVSKKDLLEARKRIQAQ